MLAYQLPLERSATSTSAIRERLAPAPACGAELVELADVLRARSRRDRNPIPGAEDVPLVLHGAYTSVRSAPPSASSPPIAPPPSPPACSRCTTGPPSCSS
jgi:hypothetical protein